MTEKLSHRIVGFVHRVAYATLFGLLCWAFSVFPLGEYPRLQGFLAKALDLPVALAGQLLPCHYRAIDLFFGGCSMEYPTAEHRLVAHLKLAIPVYVLLFYLPKLIGGGIGLLRRRRRARLGPAAGASPESARSATA